MTEIPSLVSESRKVRSIVATATGCFSAREKEMIPVSVSEVSNFDPKILYFLFPRSSMAAFARPPVFEARVRLMCRSSPSTRSSVEISIGPGTRSLISSEMSRFCSSIIKRKLVSRSTIKRSLVLIGLFRSRSGANFRQFSDLERP